jgi:hypothetical protein
LLASSPSEATPFLLELARAQAARRRPADLAAQWARDSFVASSPLDQRTVHALDGIALEAASAFEAVQLSPVAPLGVCSAIAPTSQDRTLSASRGTEVVSDPTNVLALECARRLRVDPSAHPRLCTVHQTLRAQALPPVPGFTQHFRLFAFVQAGRGRAEDGFEVAAVVEHLRVMDALFDAATALGYRVAGRAVRVLTAERPLRARVATAIRGALPHVELTEGDLESPYYQGLRVLFDVRSPDGELRPLGDTGRFDWVARLASNEKLRFIASGVGIQLFPLLFGSAVVP